MAQPSDFCIKWETLLAIVCGLVWTYPSSGGTMAVDVPSIPRQILIYGGNGFMGARTSEILLEAGHQLTLVNRGNWYWDSAFTVRPHVRNIVCDRAQSMDKCSELKDFIGQSDGLHAVIDFSAYHPQFMEDALTLLKGKVGLYIYISTDSVYEVCAKNHTGPTLETDAVRPADPDARADMEGKESYGNYKLECEEVLARHRSNEGGPPYLSLRLPDVVGPRDSTYRWWIYQMWMMLKPFLQKEVTVPASLVSQPISLVYSEDVAHVVAKFAQEGAKTENLALFDQAYNLALRETPTLYKLLQDIRAELNLTDSVEIKTESREDTIRLFPSVRKGPVNISKAEKLLGWNPSDYKTVVHNTVQFYETAIKTVRYDFARKYMLRTMQTYFTKKPYDVIRGLRDVYHLNYPQRDEL